MINRRSAILRSFFLWLGDARGYWQGDTLVAESSNFIDKSHYYWAWPWRSSRPSLKLTDYFTLLDATTIDYRFTIEDPEMFSQSWAVAVPLTSSNNLIVANPKKSKCN